MTLGFKTLPKTCLNQVHIFLFYHTYREVDQFSCFKNLELIWFSIVIKNLKELTGALGDSDMSDDEVVAGDVLKEGDIMIHPRSDCPLYQFKKTFKQQKIIPENELFCPKCFCYICDIP